MNWSLLHNKASSLHRIRGKIAETCSSEIIVRIGRYAGIGAVSIGSIQCDKVFVGCTIDVAHLDGNAIADHRF